MSAPAASAELPPAPTAAGRRPAPARLPHGGRLAGALLAVALGAALSAVALGAEGGLQLRPLTTVLVSLDIAAGVLCALAILVARPVRRPWGTVTLALFALLALLTGVSILWAIRPDVAWIETNRTVSLLATFAVGIALARLAPGRWRALLGGVLIAALVVSGYALATKVLPGSLAADETYARLREPFGYWNAVGLMAALGVPICAWLGARRDGHAAIAALAHPALGLLVITILLAYSRGALLAVVAGMALWLALVPLRLRAAAVLLPGGLLGALAAFWTFGQRGLSDDRVPLSLRSDAGTELGILLGALLATLLVIGLVITWMRDRRPWPRRTRQAWGTALLMALALAPVGLAAVLATTERGLGGSVSKAWRDLTDPDANSPKNDPSRLTAVGSVRARYWRDAIEIFDQRPELGVGAGGYVAARLRVRRDDLDVVHAHGFLAQTAADLGIAGLAVSLALLAAWLAAAGRTIGSWRGAGRDAAAPERIGMLTLAAVVVVFGVHSLVDWTWFIPGTAVPALLCAGWLVGRGPIAERPAPRAELAPARGARTPWKVMAALLVLALAVSAAWSATRPQAASDRTDEALAALADGEPAKAIRLAREAREIDPLSLAPLNALAAAQTTAGWPVDALATLHDAVALQPANVEAWMRLARTELQQGRPRDARRDARPALYLDPRSTAAQALYLEADRAAKESDASRAADRKSSKKKR
ncbi:MAG: O-antigen ligase family protein [Solirubrobacteraceae bacterium]|nr:O-antigen ligase family protein [Solirubrobacteraceae bacterium]